MVINARKDNIVIKYNIFQNKRENKAFTWK